MPRKKKPPISFVEQMRKLRAASLEHRSGPGDADSVPDPLPELETLSQRVRKLLGIVDYHKKNRDRMLFFVMYDIESNKVRALVRKYLLRKGCFPVQRSIFLADAAVDVYEQIKRDLAEVQDSYENEDSIIVLPVSTDYLRMMKVIGQKIEVDIITHSRNTLFF